MATYAPCPGANSRDELRCLRGCLAAYGPCPGYAWCGANSRDEFKSAVMRACRNNRVDSCVVNLKGISVTTVDSLKSIIDRPFQITMLGTPPLGPS